MRTTVRTIAFALAAAALSALPALAQTSVSLTFANQNEESLDGCGAATGQMVMNGYPSGPCHQIQADVWDSIQMHKVETSWDTDPAGLRDAMATLCPLPAGHHWVASSNTNAQTLMHSVAFWMNTNHFPVALLLSTNPHNALTSHREHWVAVKRVDTDLNPVTNSTVTLQLIVIVDQPTTFGAMAVERTITGSDWYTSNFEAVSNAASSFNGKFVAVIEPPDRTGTATAKLLPLTGTVIPMERIIPLAQQAIQSGPLAKVESFRELARLQAQQPILVNPERAAYYIVPFAAPGTPPTAAILINAYSGDLMEGGRFAPRAILTEKEAVVRALNSLGRETAKEIRATPLRGESPYFPVWRVNLDGEELLVHSSDRVVQPGRQRPQ